MFPEVQSPCLDRQLPLRRSGMTGLLRGAEFDRDRMYFSVHSLRERAQNDSVCDSGRDGEDVQLANTSHGRPIRDKRLS